MPSKATASELWQGLLHESAGQDGVKLDAERLKELREEREKQELMKLVEPLLAQDISGKVHPKLFDYLPVEYLKRLH